MCLLIITMVFENDRKKHYFLFCFAVWFISVFSASFWCLSSGFPYVFNDYQRMHLSFGFILVPTLQLKALANLSKLANVPITRTDSGEWALYLSVFSTADGIIFEHQIWKWQKLMNYLLFILSQNIILGFCRN